MLSDYAERKAGKIERYNDLAVKNEIKSAQLSDQAHRMADVIPFGQPILVGHYSEGRDRNYRARINRTFEKSVETSEKAEYYAKKAERLEKNRDVSSDDPEAIERLKEKLAKREKFQNEAKKINAIIRKKNTSQEEKVKMIVDLGYQESTAIKLFEKDFAGRIGIPAYELTNNNADIRRIKERIEQLTKQRTEITTEQEIGDIRIVDSVEDNRVMIFFPGIPDEGIRHKLKSAGFRWSPSNKAWQAYRTAAWQIPYIVMALTVMPAYVSPADTFFDPCGGRVCNECEIGGCLGSEVL